MWHLSACRGECVVNNCVIVRSWLTLCTNYMSRCSVYCTHIIIKRVVGFELLTDLGNIPGGNMQLKDVKKFIHFSTIWLIMFSKFCVIYKI